MEVLEVARQIEKKINQSEDARKKLKEYSVKYAETIVAFDKAMAITMAKLQAGRELPLDGTIIKCTTATNLKDYAKPLCEQQQADMLIADAMYKNCVTQIKAILAELNSLQSIYRHLDSTGSL